MIRYIIIKCYSKFISKDTFKTSINDMINISLSAHHSNALTNILKFVTLVYSMNYYNIFIEQYFKFKNMFKTHKPSVLKVNFSFKFKINLLLT
jgi:hypothetical protein